ncbi:DNA gyrase/topoisomerase IV subunit A, partial [Myroides odoratimimus]|nr:DNA gyrase/topoisomerase IV subunit A [Myroides odoratimimus]
ELRSFDTIEATKVVLRNTKLYVNREEGFFGTGLRKDEYVCDCSDIDDVIVFLRDGSMMVSRVDEKKFVGKDIIHIAVWDKNDKRTIYNLIYRDGKSGSSYIKRFNVTGVTRDKMYPLTQDKPGSQVLYFSANPNGEAEVLTILLRQLTNVKKLKFDLDFAELLIKGRAAKGNVVTKYAIKK